MRGRRYARRRRRRQTGSQLPSPATVCTMLVLSLVLLLYTDVAASVTNKCEQQFHAAVLSDVPQNELQFTCNWAPIRKMDNEKSSTLQKFNTDVYLPRSTYELVVPLGVKDDNLIKALGSSVNIRLQFDNTTWTETISDTTAMSESMQSLVIRVDDFDSSTETQMRLSTWLKRFSAKQFPQLQTVDMSRNKLSNLRMEGFEPMTQVTVLYLKKCGLETIQDIRPAFPNIEVLDLSENADLYLINGLETVQTLKYLDLSGTMYFRESNFLTALNWQSLPKKLEYLAARKCQILISDYVQTLQLPFLKYLILDENTMRYLNSGTFRNLPSGVTISLRGNNLHDVTQLEINNASYLDLSANSIALPDSVTLVGEVGMLDLSENSLVNWTSLDVFNNENQSIIGLNLSYNKISFLTPKMRESLSDLKTIDLGGNPFDCSPVNCELPKFQSWLQYQNNVYNLGELKTLNCTSPLEYTDMSIMEVQINDDVCNIKLNFALFIGTPLIVVVIIIIVVLVYVHRYHVLYIAHLLRMRRRAEKRVCDDLNAFEYDLFVSYSTNDRDWVINVLLETLESPEKKYALCLHERDFRLGNYIMENIADSINTSRRVLLVLSPNFINSQWCQWELKLVQQVMFENRPDFLILVELTPLGRDHLPSTLRLLMNTRTYLEWPDTPDLHSRFWTRLIAALGPPLAETNPKDRDSSPEPEELTAEQLSEQLRLCYLENVRVAMEGEQFEAPPLDERL